MVYNFALYIVTLIRMDKILTSSTSLIRVFSLFVISFIICSIWGVINRIQNWLAPESPVFLLYAFQAFFSPLNGFFNAIVYGLNDELREKIRESCLCFRTKYEEFILPRTNSVSDWKKEYDAAPERIPEKEYEEYDVSMESRTINN